MTTPYIAVEHITSSPSSIRCCGRLHGVRRHGRMTFADLWLNGHRIQISYRGRDCPWLSGMWVEIEGPVHPTNSGEMTVWCEHCTIHSQPTRPLEEGVEQGQNLPEQQYILDPQQIQLAYRRSGIVRRIREFFWEQQFQEVSTPILSPFNCGAAAGLLKRISDLPIKMLFCGLLQSHI